jgi:hypothetical protein
MPASPRNRETCPDGCVKSLIIKDETVLASEDREVLFLVAMKVQRRTASGSSDGFDNRISPVRKAGEANRDALAEGSLVPRAGVI